jgi:Fic family protein
LNRHENRHRIASMDVSYGLAPFLPADPASELRTRAYDLATASARLSGRPAPTVEALREMLRLVNSYYSNLIEGQGTRPAEVDAAMRARSQRQKLPDLVCLALSVAKAEEQAMAWLVREPEAQAWLCKTSFVCDLHRSVYEGLPESLLLLRDEVEQPAGKLVPGELRKKRVVVGRHEPIAPEYLDGAMQVFDAAYARTLPSLRGEMGLVAAAAAHHRLTWIHPFVDGNGRAARLFSSVYLASALGHLPVWSLPRGLARTRKDYYALLSTADAPQLGSYDGHGPRSDEGLFKFCRYFLDTCLDQARYMESVLELDGYRRRVDQFVDKAAAGALPNVPMLDPAIKPVLVALMAGGELPRSDAWQMTGYKERKARAVVKALEHAGLAVAHNKFAPLRPAFPPALIEDLFPKLSA